MKFNLNGVLNLFAITFLKKVDYKSFERERKKNKTKNRIALKSFSYFWSSSICLIFALNDFSTTVKMIVLLFFVFVFFSFQTKACDIGHYGLNCQHVCGHCFKTE